jgi:hypothetical protein
MELVLRYSGLQGRRLILSLPFWLGTTQAFFLEKLPETIFTLTRDQVSRQWSSTAPVPLDSVLRSLCQVTQLRSDNIVSPVPPLNALSFDKLLAAFPSSLPSSQPGNAGLTSVHKVLPRYLGPAKGVEQGKRTHGRGSAVDQLGDVQRTTRRAEEMKGKGQ